ncbi:MAG: energy transducer TonB [Acidobacteriota bacterium]|nr:energy transducer TonB [Acidobacteriota bacterium]
MNRTMVSALVLPCALACAGVGMAVEPKSMSSSGTVVAEVREPAGLAEVALAAGGSHGSLVAANAATHAVVKESVKAVFTGQDFIEASLRQGGTLEFAMKGNAPMTSQAPKVTKAVEVDLTPEDLSQTGAETTVTLHAIVDENGFARNVQVTKSAGAAVVDRKAIAAVREYRFKPAMVDNVATWSGVSVTIKIQK